MADLESLGFVAVGHWALSPATASGITFHLTSKADERVIYAFVVNGQPVYIGVTERTTTTLRARMARYRGLVGAGTNARVAGKIRESLQEGKGVAILALNPSEPLFYQNLPVDLVKGLEYPLIERFNPEWNTFK